MGTVGKLYKRKVKEWPYGVYQQINGIHTIVRMPTTSMLMSGVNVISGHERTLLLDCYCDYVQIANYEGENFD